MADSMAFVYDSGSYAGVIRQLRVTWTADADGTATGTSAEINGFLLKAITDPDGTSPPSDNYDIVITDEHGLNVLADSTNDLLDRDTATTESTILNLSDGTASIAAYPAVMSPLTFTISNATAQAYDVTVTNEVTIPLTLSAEATAETSMPHTATATVETTTEVTWPRTATHEVSTPLTKEVTVTGAVSAASGVIYLYYAPCS